MVTFALNTNLNGTVNLVFRDNIQLYQAALLSLTDAGYFKIAMTFILPITMLLDPFIAPTFAEITRTIAKFEWKTTFRLLNRAYEERDGQLQLLRFEPPFDRLRGDPRFVELMRKVGLPPD